MSRKVKQPAVCREYAHKTRRAECCLETRPKYPEPTHVEEMLYARFSSRNGVAMCDQFHAAPLEKRQKLAHSLEDERFKELALGIVKLRQLTSLLQQMLALTSNHLT